MRTIIKLILVILAVYGGMQFAYHMGYKYTDDKTYDIDIPELKPVKSEFDSTLLKPPSKEKYKGKWVDVN